MELNEFVANYNRYTDEYRSFFGLDKEDVKSYINEHDAYDIAKAAKEGDKLAYLALFSVCERMALSKLFTGKSSTISFFGPKPSPERVNDPSQLKLYFTLVEEAMYKMVQAIDVEKLHDGSAAKGGLEFYLRGYLTSEIKQYLKDELSGGTESDEVSTVSLDADDDAAYKDALIAQSGAESVDVGNDSSVLADLAALKNDPAWSKAKYDYGAILKDYLVSGSISNTSDTTGISKNTLRYNVLPEIGKILSDRGINITDMSKLLKQDAEALLSVL